MDRFREKRSARRRRHLRIRKKIFGTKDLPRLSVTRSLRNIFAQLIDDTKGITLLSVSSLSKEVKEDEGKPKGKLGISRKVGVLVAKKALENGIKRVVFDRGGFLYHGRVKSFADGAREGGLEF